jgi:hypothetical protein
MLMDESEFLPRIEHLECEVGELKEEVEKTNSALKDTTILAKSAFLLGFRAQAAKAPDFNKLLDAWTFFFQREGLSTEALESLVGFLTED